MKSRVHPTYKTKYHVQNWAAYDRALVCRGDITIWLSPAAIAAWEPDGAGTRGAQRKYSDLAIESALTLRLLFHLPRRQTEGFLTSLFVLMGLDLRSPDHTTLSRRGQHLDRRLRLVDLIDFDHGTYVLDTAAIRHLVDAATTADPRYTPSTTRREARTLDSQARYARWQTAYRALKQRRPQMSDVWYASQIAKQAVAAGCQRTPSADT